MSTDNQVNQQIQQMSDAFKTLNKLFKDKHHQIEVLLRQKENLTCTCRDQGLWIEQLQKKTKELEQSKTQAEETLSKYTDQQARLDGLSSQLQASQDDLKTAQMELKEQHQQNEQIKQQHHDSQSQISTLQKQIATAEKENLSLKNDLKSLHHIRSQYESECTAGREKDEQIKELTRQLDHIGSQFNELTDQLNQQVEEVNHSQKIIDDLQAQIEPSEDDPAYKFVQNLNRNMKDCKQIFGDASSSPESQKTPADDSQKSRRNNLHRKLSILNGS